MRRKNILNILVSLFFFFSLFFVLQGNALAALGDLGDYCYFCTLGGEPPCFLKTKCEMGDNSAQANCNEGICCGNTGENICTTSPGEDDYCCSQVSGGDVIWVCGGGLECEESTTTCTEIDQDDCNYVGAPCCGLNVCFNGLVCKDEVCISPGSDCGELGNICCAGRICNQGDYCSTAGACECSDATYCIPSTNPNFCGERGDLCCSGNVPVGGVGSDGAWCWAGEGECISLDGGSNICGDPEDTCGLVGFRCCTASDPPLGNDPDGDGCATGGGYGLPICVDGMCETNTDTNGGGGTPKNLVYNGPVIDELNKILGPLAKILYFGGLFIGISFIVYSGYKLMTSQGNPQQTQDAQEQLTAAVLGIIFILLSAAILRVILKSIIGADIDI